MADYEIYLDNDQGTRLILLEDFSKLEYARTVNTIGYAVIEAPGDIDISYFDTDRLVEIWRRPEDGAMGLDFMGFVRAWEYATSETGLTVVRATVADLNDLLRRRVVAYNTDTSQGAKTDYADDMMKEIVTENLGTSATNSDRKITSAIGVTFQVQTDTSQGQTVTHVIAWKNMLEMLQEIAEASRTAGTEVYFDIVPLSPTVWEFQTFANQRGTDRTWTSGIDPLIFSPELGNLEIPVLTIDRTAEINFAYAGGQGEGSNRSFSNTSDADRIGASQWNRCEGFIDARQCDTSACRLAAAQSMVSDGRPLKTFTGRLVNTRGFRYGRDWFFGDRVSIHVFGTQFDAMVRNIHVMVNERGRETVETKVEATL